MTDDLERRSYLPWLMVALILVIGGAKLDATRPLLANTLAVLGPIIPAAMGVSKLYGGNATVERAALLVGGAAVLAGEVCVVGGFFGVEALGGSLTAARRVLYAAVLAALVVDTHAVTRGMNGRFAALIGISCVFALHLSSQSGSGAFGRVFGAFFVALALGGGVGLVAGELSGRCFKPSK